MVAPLCTLLAWVVLVGSATAQPPAAPGTELDLPAFDVRLQLDLPITVLAATVSFAWILAADFPPPQCAPLCDPEGINPIDRGSAGSWDPRWHDASNIAFVGLVAGSTATVLIDDPGSFLNDALVIIETVMVSTAVTVSVGLAADRPRPLLYSEAAPLEERNDGVSGISFPSGHVASSAALTMAVFSTLKRRHPHSALPWVALGTGAVATAVVGTGRVLSGNHFPLDVFAGLLMGSAVGMLVPALHADPRVPTRSHDAALVPSVGRRRASLTYQRRF